MMRVSGIAPNRYGGDHYSGRKPNPPERPRGGSEQPGKNGVWAKAVTHPHRVCACHSHPNVLPASAAGQRAGFVPFGRV